MTHCYRSLGHNKTSLCIIVILLALSQSRAIIEQNEIHEILEVHNVYRRMFANGAYNVYVADMKKLEWSTELQDKARRRLQCNNLNLLSTSLDLKMNIGSSLHRNLSYIIRIWFTEFRYFLPKFKTCQYLSNCSRFLKMINAEHRRVGCDVKTCLQNNARSNVMLCLYDGATSLVDPYQSGLPCTKCKDEESFCDRGLCVPCADSSSNCDCRKTCRSPGVGAGRLNSTTCTCKCSYGMGSNCDEPCQNPEMYLDYDICETVSAENCLTEDPEEREMLAEFCPEQCTCRKPSETNSKA